MTIDLFTNCNTKNPVPIEICLEIANCLNKGYILSDILYEQTNFKMLAKSHSLPWIRRDAIDFTFKSSSLLTVNNPPVYGPVKPIIISNSNLVFSHHHNLVGKSKYRRNLIEKHNNPNSLVGNNDYFSIVHCGKFNLESINLRLEFIDGTFIDFPVDLISKSGIDNIQEEIKDLTDSYLREKTQENIEYKIIKS